MRASLDPAPGAQCVQAARAAYELGLACYRKKQWQAAARQFGEAVRQCGPDDLHLNLYMSWQGMCLVSGGDAAGLDLCRRAASAETIQPRVFLNLALAELRLEHRRLACKAVEVGLSVDHRDPGLLRLRDRMGVRRRPILPFLRRDHPLNRWLGHYTWWRLRSISVQASQGMKKGSLVDRLF